MATKKVLTKLQEMAIAYEFSKCHGYCPDSKDAKDLWTETYFKKNQFPIKFLDNYSGMSSNEISNMINREVLKDL